MAGQRLTAGDILAHLLTQKLLQNQENSSSDEDTPPVSARTGIPSPARLPDYVVVVALDFGTTFSGYACSFKGSEDSVQMNKNWGSTSGYSSYKTPTSVLLGPDETLRAFGYQAQEQYSAMTEEDARACYYFERFKMILHHTKVQFHSLSIPLHKFTPPPPP